MVIDTEGAKQSMSNRRTFHDLTFSEKVCIVVPTALYQIASYCLVPFQLAAGVVLFVSDYENKIGRRLSRYQNKILKGSK
jgi:hypothetical protein